MLIRTSILLFISAMFGSFALEPAAVWAAKPTVSLVLSKASAERSEKDVCICCEIELDNATGKELTVRSNFYTAFDGVELVVTTREGKILEQQGYTFHQSPFTSLGREFTLKEGSTSGSLRFPLRSLPREEKVFKIRLVGMLPGSEYRRILSSETLEVHVKD